MDITKYADFTNEIDPKILQDVESRLRILLKQKWPQLDTSPSCVFGNLFVTPAARVVAMIEQATNCILSDLNLENALNGVVCDCDFIQTFLKGLGLSTLQEANTTAMVRINFIQEPEPDSYFSFDQGELMLFDDTYIFSFIPGNDPTIKIYPTDYNYSNKSLNKVNNEYKLSRGSTTLTSGNVVNTSSYFVDLPVYGPGVANLPQGSLAKIDENFGNEASYKLIVDNNIETTDTEPLFDLISSVELLHDVTPLQLPTTLEELITLTRKVLPAASLTTRANSISYMTHRFPSLRGVSMVLSGDKELQRVETGNETLNLVDLYVKGPHTISCTEHFVVKEDTSSPTGYSAPINKFQHIPLIITDVSVANISNTEVSTSDAIKSNGLTSTDYMMKVSASGESNPLDAFYLLGKDNTTKYIITLNGAIGEEHLTITPATESEDGLVLKTIKNSDTGATYSTEIVSAPSDSSSATIQFTKVVTGLDIFNTDNQTFELIATELLTSESKFVTVTYLYDPVAEAVIKHINGPTCKPAFNIIVRPFVTANVKKLEITYRKTAGRFFDRQKAIEEIYDFISSLTYPTIYDDAYLGDIMMACGASGIDNINVDVDYQMSGATGGYDPKQIVENSDSLDVNDLKSGIKDYFGIGVRNINYIIPNRDNIQLIERNTAHI